MDIKDIITLLNAGYTKADIEAMAQPQPQTQTQPQPQTQTQPQPQPQTQTHPQPQTQTQPQPQPQTQTHPQQSAVEQKLDALINALQLSNIANLGNNPPAGGQTPEDVVKEFFK